METKKENGKGGFKRENHVTLSGRLTGDPILSGDAVRRAFFTLAVERGYKKSGNKGEEASFIPVVAWRSVVEKVEKLGRGSTVRIEGTLRTSKIVNAETKETKTVWEVSAFKIDIITAKAPGREENKRPVGSN